MPRFNETVNGDVTMIANNMLSRDPFLAYNGESDNHNFIDNVYVDIDSDASTFNSSSANFINPHPELACLTIQKAFLYWAAADKEMDNGEDNQPDWNFNDIKLMLPGEINYSTLTADEVLYRGRDTHFSNDPYICFKDITAAVTDLDDPFGTYQVANVEAKIGNLIQHDGGNIGTSGGWQIVFVYQSPELITRNIGLFDGYAHISQAFNNFDIDFSGFQTVPNGPVNANIVLGSLEGDRILPGDRFQIRNTLGDFVDLMAPLREPNNFFNSRITLGNTEFTDRNPSSLNTLGFDAAVFPLINTGNSILSNNQTSATIRLTSDQETYGLFMIGLSVEVRAPNLYPITLNTSASGNVANANETVSFGFNLSNSGNDDAVNVVLSTILPTNLEFVSANDLPAGITFAYDIDSRLLQFFVQDGLLNVGSPALNIQFELRINEVCYFLQENCDLFFEIQLEASYNGVENTDPKITLSSHNIDDCRLGTSLPISINLPDSASWTNFPSELDREIICDDPGALDIAHSLEPDTDTCDFELIKTSGDFVPDSEIGFSGTYTNTWTFMDACGRTIADYVQTITINNDCFDAVCTNAANIEISRAVTANGDPWNEFFTVTGFEGCGYIPEVKLFNRWGALIYSSPDYQNNWNGFVSNSSVGSSGKVPSGTYYYVVNLKGSTFQPFVGAIYVGA